MPSRSMSSLHHPPHPSHSRSAQLGGLQSAQIMCRNLTCSLKRRVCSSSCSCGCDRLRRLKPVSTPPATCTSTDTHKHHGMLLRVLGAYPPTHGADDGWGCSCWLKGLPPNGSPDMCTLASHACLHKHLLARPAAAARMVSGPRTMVAHGGESETPSTGPTWRIMGCGPRGLFLLDSSICSW